MGLQVKPLIPFFGVDRQYAGLREEILECTDKVYTSGRVLDGDYTQQFEAEIAKRTDRTFAISVNSGTQALVFALQSIFPAGQVVVPTLSFIATLNSVLLTEHEPVFVDTDYSGLLDLSNTNFSLNNENIAAIMYVNLYGNVIDYDKLKVLTNFWGKGPRIIEDAAQSFGATYKGIPSGKLGDVSILSFDPTKNLNNYGSGGMLLTDDTDLAYHYIDLRDNGKMGDHEVPGTNSKMSESDCAQMLIKLKYFDDWQERRHAIATYYQQQFGHLVDVIGPGEDVVPSWHKFVLCTNRRGALADHLRLRGVETKIHYPTTLDNYSVSHNVKLNTPSTEVSSYIVKNCLSLPIYPELTDSEVESIAQAVKSFF